MFSVQSPYTEDFYFESTKEMQSFIKSSQISDEADVIEFNNDLKTH